MKKVFFLLLIFLTITSNLFSLQQNFQYPEESLSFSYSPATFLSILPWQDEDGNSTPMPFLGISVNLGSSNVEHDWFLSVYPSEYSFGYERRIFPSYKKKGFFYGFFASFDYRKFVLVDNGIDDGIMVDLFGLSTENDFWTLGFRIGTELGFRIRLGDYGITPKIGFGIPLYYPLGLKEMSDDYWSDYFLTLATSSIFIGLKFDIMNCEIKY